MADATMTTVADEVEAGKAGWYASLAARDEHAGYCCGTAYRSCPEGVRLEQAEDAAWHIYFDARVRDGSVPA